MTVVHDEPDPGPEPLHEWTAAGFDVGRARRWIGAGFPLDAALRWRAGGVHAPADASAWRAAGVSPHAVLPMLRAGMTPRDAVQWHELGYSHAEAADRHLAGERPRPRRWWRTLLRRRARRPDALADDEADAMRELLASGVGAATARAYLDAGWRCGEDAASWAATGIDPAGAAAWRAIGLRPAEAAALAAGGADAFDVLRRWWDAGVPREEAASWLVAGFTPDEALRARADGATAERAAVLRALGGGIGTADAGPDR